MTPWIRPLTATTEGGPDTLGAKAHGLVLAHRLGLPVPPAFVVTTDACRAYLRDGRLPGGLHRELAAAVARLEAATGRAFGGPGAPLAVSVRSGAAHSMPGMMTTVLNLGLTTGATARLAAETGDPAFARDSLRRLLTGIATALGADPAPGDDPDRLLRRIRDRRDGRPFPDDASGQLTLALETVFSSWHTPRARTYRALHDIPHDLGTAAVVQAMVFGNRDARSGSGVAFSRDPTTGANTPYGDVLFGHQGEDVVSGTATTHPLPALADREPAVWQALRAALHRAEAHYRDACYAEFTFQAGTLWILQLRPGRFTSGAAVRLATELADAGVITRREAVRRVTPRQLGHLRVPRLADPAGADLLTRGIGAVPGVATGRIATTADRAARLGPGTPVILVRPETSPHDLHGLAAATGVLTARGGPAGHAAVVARTLGRPAVVGARDLTVDPGRGTVTAGGRTLPEGTLLTLDGTGGHVALGAPPLTTGDADGRLDRLLGWADALSGDTTPRDPATRLAAAHTALGHPAP
ncbi:pyruvate, phosphate dikinase [Streptomyces sp. AA0539]|uniref:pyruvate, phosphate dikinase n=1 Tax=Streptomyces sp. AA0539 TaxID=1210045 RepID=UPI0002DC8BE5|nr:pyruvate, phosphate dikinase [Streptomyces sp. AA0539]